jgi:putative restriction endonuclease
MNLLERSLIEKAGYANGWENVRENSPERVALFSSRHAAEAIVSTADANLACWRVVFPNGPQAGELARGFSEARQPDDSFHVEGEAALGRLLRRAAELAMSLPNHAAHLFAEEVKKLDATRLEDTEALRLVKQRIGQNLYRQALLEYWGGACALTGLAIPALLRASHSKPWADCESDSERLNVFNGFLLAAHFDALFDAGFITFTEGGHLLRASKLTETEAALLGIESPLSLRWISPLHLSFLAWHRANVFAG